LRTVALTTSVPSASEPPVLGHGDERALSADDQRRAVLHVAPRRARGARQSGSGADDDRAAHERERRGGVGRPRELGDRGGHRQLGAARDAVGGAVAGRTPHGGPRAGERRDAGRLVGTADGREGGEKGSRGDRLPHAEAARAGRSSGAESSSGGGGHDGDLARW
jgi:hypothetical protein